MHLAATAESLASSAWCDVMMPAVGLHVTNQIAAAAAALQLNSSQATLLSILARLMAKFSRHCRSWSSVQSMLTSA